MEKARGGMEAENDSLQWEVFYQVISTWLSCNECNYIIVFKNTLLHITFL